MQEMQPDGANEISPDVIDLIVERVTARLAACLMDHFDVKHDMLVTRMSALEELIHASSSDIKDDTKFTRVLARQSFAEYLASLTEQTPAKDEPPPLDFVHATNTDPDAGNQRVDLDRFGAVAILRPGTDTDDAWDEVRTGIRKDRGAR